MTHGPELCRWCSQDLAVEREWPYCEKCASALRPERWKYRTSEPDEAGDARKDEKEERWGADVFYAPWSSDYGRGE